MKRRGMKMVSVELIVKEIVELGLPERCRCGFFNLNIWGTRTNGRLDVEVRCMRCGEPLSKVESHG